MVARLDQTDRILPQGSPTELGASYENLAPAAFFYGTRADYSRITDLAHMLHESGAPVYLVDTGQQWDSTFIGEGLKSIQSMSLQTHTSDVEEISRASKKFLVSHPCRFVVVYGDTASTLGPALAAKELGIPIVHMEAGFRSYDGGGKRLETDLPEESIRIFVDRIADVNVPLISRAYNELVKEKHDGLVGGIITDPVGHPLADPIVANADFYDNTSPDEQFGILTIHRKANVEDNGSRLSVILQQLAKGEAKRFRWLFPAHPGVRKLIKKAGIPVPSNVRIVNPLSHEEILAQMARASMLVSDSNGLQVEASLMGRKLVVPRDEVCYADLLDACVLTSPEGVAKAVQKALDTDTDKELLARLRKEFCTGNSAARMFEILDDLLKS